MQVKENKMGTYKILPLLLTMSIPPTISMLINSLYNIVDSIFVARLGTEALTAVSLAFPIQNLILAIAVGSGVGLNSYIARKLGERKEDIANKTAGNGITLAIIHYLILCILGIFFIKRFFQLFVQEENILKLGVSYTYIIIFFSIGIIAQIAIEKILQATGNTLTPMYLQIIGAVVNIVLDPILIYGYFGLPAMGVKGAAIATIIGQLIALFCSVYVLFFKKQSIKILKQDFFIDRKIVKEIYNVGIPSFFIMSIGSFLVMGINLILSEISNLAISLFGIYFKLQTFIYMPTSGVTQGAMPIMGYSYGARNSKRVSEVLNYSIIICVIINFLGSALFWLYPKEILQFFEVSDEMLSMGVQTMRIMSTSYSFGSVCFIFSCFLQAIGKGFSSLIITLLRQFILLLPIAYIFGKIYGLIGVWASFPIVDIVTCIISVFMYKNFLEKDPVMTLNKRKYCNLRN
ncbi:Staphylococcal virulence regulator protein A [Fusobacterium necrogenes]|uniref:Staphylococcal virulence regulator protein A n=1 Tax=Fusobacterium necrogenes TaxID=858 RepID=A0A377GZE9_9FUSO|nr:MATE family efflux transporter [Fusobacterium necrogenes]STO32338.1 Staphylococcal virulence regulator protein A [Fusobacterium necrogenes]